MTVATPQNVLDFATRADFRAWLEANAHTAPECWLCLKRGEPKDPAVFYYLDAVEEALCFGWIDSTLGLVNGVRMQRFSTRAQKSNWTALNLARVARLETLGLMTPSGRAVLPPPDSVALHDDAVERALREAGAWEQFCGFPLLYRQVRMNNLVFACKQSLQEYEKALDHCIKETARGKMYGQWNDYGRLV